MKSLRLLGLFAVAILSVLLITGCGSKNVDGSLESIMSKVYKELPQDKTPMMLMNTEVTEENVEYYCFGIGYNADAELGEPTYVKFTVNGDGVVEVLSNEFTVSPNPAKSTVNVRLNGNAQVRIFDMTGRCVKDVNATDNTTINIEDLNKGVYFVNVNGKVEKLVIE